jgi:hypothetical protein
MHLQHNKPAVKPIQVLTMVKFGPTIILCLDFTFKNPHFCKENPCVCKKLYGWIFFCDMSPQILFITFV